MTCTAQQQRSKDCTPPHSKRPPLHLQLLTTAASLTTFLMLLFSDALWTFHGPKYEGFVLAQASQPSADGGGVFTQ